MTSGGEVPRLEAAPAGAEQTWGAAQGRPLSVRLPPPEGIHVRVDYGNEASAQNRCFVCVCIFLDCSYNSRLRAPPCLIHTCSILKCSSALTRIGLLLLICCTYWGTIYSSIDYSGLLGWAPPCLVHRYKRVTWSPSDPATLSPATLQPLSRVKRSPSATSKISIGPEADSFTFS